jgi:3-deoxy-D-manno-octulosonic-acid transferase
VHFSSNEQSALLRSLRLYRTLGPFVSALLAPVFIRRLIKRGGYKAHFLQRFGKFENAELERLKQHSWIWIRSISVGETLVALKLAKALRKEDPDAHIALSVTTTTAYAIAEKEASEWLFVFYNPVDSQGAVQRVMRLLRPQKLVLIEGELWPNLMSACLEHRVPVMLANARLSPRSARRFAKFKEWTAPFFKLLSWVAIPDEDDRLRWESIGVPSERLQLTGSIKFDQTGEESGRQQEFSALLKASGVLTDDPLLIAGSTHDGEEEILIQSLKFWRKKHPRLRLIIAPRHVERIPSLLHKLAPLGVPIVRRTALPTSQSWDVVLLDTTGELRDWYPLATVAFVGKSLTAAGGQNPVEPALSGRPVVFGPHMENFESAVQLLLTHEGALQADSVESLERLIDGLLGDPGTRETLGTNGLAALSIHQGATKRTAELIVRTRTH